MMQRYDYLEVIAGDAGDALTVCTGWAAREWWAVRPSDGNLKTRTLGLVSSIAAGLAFALPHRKVIALDGDGAFLMNLCGLPTIALQNPPNLIHLLFDNGVPCRWPKDRDTHTPAGSIRRKSLASNFVKLGRPAASV
jgi:thiamine pyrophosphate-dependent acetolactate synthase large subunit-like protein